MLAVFSVSIVMILCGVVLVKHRSALYIYLFIFHRHSFERLFDPPAVTMYV